jgi:hypothetical protein
MEKNYFDAYSYDTIWSLAYLYQSQLFSNQANTEIFKKAIENIDFIGATVSEFKEGEKFCRDYEILGKSQVFKWWTNRRSTC